MPFPYLPWYEDAACSSTTVPSSWFFTPDLHTGSEKNLPGIRICDHCPVSDACLDYALSENILVGVWGGKTSAERRRIKRRRYQGTVAASTG